MGKKKKFSFKESKVGKFLHEKGGDLLDVADDIFPPLGVVTKIAKATGLTKEDTDKVIAMHEEDALEFYKLEVQDRDSARNREIEVIKAGGNDIMMLVTGSVGLLAFLAIVYSVLFRTLPEANEKLIYHLLGMVEGVVITIFAYYFGSSKGSKDKSDVLENKK